MIKWLDLELKLIQLFFKFLKIDYLKKPMPKKEKNCGYKNYILEKSSNRAKLYLGDQEFV